MRTLASIQQIGSISAIDNADAIEKLMVLGWSTVARKGEFEEGDLCVFFEIDSILPETEWSEFMRRWGNYRIRTVRLRGVLSQGLALPLSVFKIMLPTEIGADVTELLGVTKYEKFVAEIKGQSPFPGFIPKTDETRIQSVPHILKEFDGREVVATVKYDGVSATYANFYKEFYVCSRDIRLDPANNPYWRIADKYKLGNIPEGIAVQGEICGPKMQGNKLGLKELWFFAFNVFDIQRGRYFNWREFVTFCKEYDIPYVGVVFLTVLDARKTTPESLLEAAEGIYPGTVNQREGIVLRPIVETYSATLNGRLSVKVINNRFLIENNE
ncbi:RNA ligase family protein [Chroococcidiopsis sp.]|uniref:RNA ligase family protein n=1 Tax=Chroococcidiopsis sp. TaxID=3088168 RepID=UPI003F325207